jgi:hypothetical protein
MHSRLRDKPRGLFARGFETMKLPKTAEASVRMGSPEGCVLQGYLNLQHRLPPWPWFASWHLGMQEYLAETLTWKYECL